MSLKEVAKRLIALTPFRVVRGAPNRYQAIGYCLQHLSRLGYEPAQIIDGGAHLGAFALEASAIFPPAIVHLIDPQPACRVPLEALAVKRGFVYHPYALSSVPGIVSMICAEFPDTGALLGHSPAGPAQKAVDVEATTLDSLFSATCKPSDRTLLKLDLQGHEMPALGGASRLLRSVEVALVEIPFFGEAGQPTVPDIIGFFRRSGFDLFDVASLSGRPRDNRLREGDFVFVRQDSPILADAAWS
ncbi:MAG: FkbM family methyltransferase [Reyranella sp.]|nr:FkbM family methyltransferase [Reyranella sp.]